MESKQSLTMVGLAVILLGYVFSKIGVPIAEGSIETTLITIIQMIGGVMAWYGRYRQGDVNVFGQAKIKE